LPLVPHASIVSDKETFGYFLDSKGTKLITGSRRDSSSQRIFSLLSSGIIRSNKHAIHQ